jgi:TetR/AcrR family transcriptional repressor of nem operon
MARQKEFDQDKALDKAMTLFWQKGYAATSIQDLVDCMGIGRRSLYDTFQSKHDLFIAALDRYRDMAYESTARSGELLVSPKMAIQEIFEGIVAEAVADRNRKGCFFVNSAVELAGQDDVLTIRSREAFQDMEHEFHTLLHQAQQAGELSPEHDIQALAHYLTNAVFGIRVMSKMNPDQQVLTNVVNLTLSILD